MIKETKKSAIGSAIAKTALNLGVGLVGVGIVVASVAARKEISEAVHLKYICIYYFF
jgi:hypothetical protein